MTIKIQVSGAAFRNVRVPAGTTVARALDSAEVDADGMRVEVNGRSAQFTQKLEEGDKVSVLAKVEAGR